MSAAAEAAEKVSRAIQLVTLFFWLLWIATYEGIYGFLFKKEKSLKGEVILITGAGQGMGRQVAFDVSRLGATLVLWDVNEVSVKEVAETIRKEGGSATWYVCDVTSEAAVNTMAKKVEKEVGDVTILINNAGIMQNVPILKLDSDRIKLTLNVNVLAHFWTIRAFLPGMEKRNRGHIVAIASGAGLIGYVNQTDYSASKHAVLGLMEAFSEELRLKGRDIKTTTICPLTVNTGLNCNPHTKYSWLMPIVSIEDAAQQIVSAIRREDYLVSIPGRILLPLRFSRLFPQRVLSEVMDYVDYCRTPNSFITNKTAIEKMN